MSVYLDAIKVLEERGWCQNAYQDEDGRVCLSTALGAVNGFGTWTWREQAVLREVEAVEGDHDIIDFNDDPFTSYETVILALKRAHEASERIEPA